MEDKFIKEHQQKLAAHATRVLQEHRRQKRCSSSAAAQMATVKGGGARRQSIFQMLHKLYQSTHEPPDTISEHSPTPACPSPVSSSPAPVHLTNNHTGDVASVMISADAPTLAIGEAVSVSAATYQRSLPKMGQAAAGGEGRPRQRFLSSASPHLQAPGRAIGSINAASSPHACPNCNLFETLPKSPSSRGEDLPRRNGGGGTIHRNLAQIEYDWCVGTGISTRADHNRLYLG